MKNSSVLLFTSIIVYLSGEYCYCSFSADIDVNATESVGIFDEKNKTEMFCGVSTYTTPNMPTTYAGEIGEANKSRVNYFVMKQNSISVVISRFTCEFT